MAKYRLTSTGVHDQERHIHIPNDPGNRHWGEYQVWLTQGSPLNVPDPMDVPSLDDLKSEAKNEVDIVAERVRQQYITQGDGQSMTYLEKRQEAEAYKLAGYPTIGSPNQYPHLTAEANATSQTEQQIADLVIATKDAWIAKSAEIEGVRMGGKKNIDDAVDETGINTARDNAVTSLEAL